MLSRRNTITSALMATALGATLALPAAGAEAAEVDLRARLQPTTAFPNARGLAEYEAEHGTRTFDITVAGVKALAGRTVTVRVHGDLVGKVQIDSLGRAHREWHVGVPTMVAGNKVVVRSASGRLVAYGSLHREAD